MEGEGRAAPAQAGQAGPYVEGNADRFAGKRWDAVDPWDAPEDGMTWWGKRHPRRLRK